MCSETTLEGSGGFKLPSLQSVGLGMTLRELLEQAIRLRSSGQAQQSLELLERAKAQGVTNGWVDDNRARALVKLDRLEEARDLWQGLEAGEDLTLRTVASQNLHYLDLQDRVELFWQQVQDLAQRFSWTLLRLNADLRDAADFEFALLEEAVLSRESGAPEMSLALMEWAQAAGFRSPWLNDNQARALLALDQVIDACSVWRLIRDSSSEAAARQAAEEMLQTCQQQERQEQLRQREQALLAQAADLADQESAEHLARGLLTFPDSADCEQALLERLDQLRQRQDQGWSTLSPWMQRQELAVELFEQVLLEVERQLLPS